MADHVAAEFAPARDSVRWAEDALADYGAVASAYFAGDVTELLTVKDPATDEAVQKIRLKVPLPHNLRRHATEALNNAKHAFDQAIFAARNLTSGPDEQNIYFPWADNPADMEGRLRRAGMDQRLWPVFAAHEPYPMSDRHPGGDDVIRALATLANRKHTVGLAIGAHVDATKVPPITIINADLSIPAPVWDPITNEMELLRFRGELLIHDSYEVNFRILFDRSSLAFPLDAMAGLHAFTSKAKAVTEDLARRCAELLA